MKRSILFSSLLVLFGTAHAELQTLDNQQLQQVEGQAGATINWTLSLNQTSPGVFDTTTCSDLRFCRLGLSLNNRYDDGSYVSNDGTIHKKNGDVTTATGRKQWLVFKGLQGTIQIQNMDISGDDLKYTADNGTDEKIKAALKVSFKKEYPILIRNLGFSALSIETDTVANEGAGNVSGYFNADKYGATAGPDIKVTTSVYDQGRETGFTGITMNGNLALQGNLKVFSCDASMKRC